MMTEINYCDGTEAWCPFKWHETQLPPKLGSSGITTLLAKGLFGIIFISNPISDLLFHIRQAAVCICKRMRFSAFGVWLRFQR